MPRFIVHHKGMFFEWSTVVDGAVTEAMTRPAFEAYYRDEYGRKGMDGLADRLDRAIANGTSSRDGMTARELLRENREGPDGEPAPFEDVIAGILGRTPDSAVP